MKINYPYLPEGREIRYVPADNEFMAAAKEQARAHSTDRMHSTGAVIVKDGRIIGKGANQTPLKHPFLSNLHKKGWCVRKLFGVKSGQKYWLCPGCAQYSDHGERQALKDAKALGHGTDGADLYLWGHWWCCQPCWAAMIDAGIANVYLLEGSEKLFDRTHAEHVMGRQFEG